MLMREKRDDDDEREKGLCWWEGKEIMKIKEKRVGKEQGELMRERTSPKKNLIDFFSGINGLICWNKGGTIWHFFDKNVQILSARVKSF